MAEIGAEGLPVTAGQVMLLDSGQIEDGLSQSPEAAWAEVDPGPGVDVSPLDSEIDDGKQPYGDEDPDQSRITHHGSNRAEFRGSVANAGPSRWPQETPSSIVGFLPPDPCLIGPTASHQVPPKNGPDH